MAISSLPKAVINTTGTKGYLRQTAATSSRPSMPGMRRSVRTTRGVSRSMAASATAPSSAYVTRQPRFCSMMAPVIRRSMAASSTTKTLISLSGAASASGPVASVMAVPSSGGQFAANLGDDQLHALDLLLHQTEDLLDSVEVALSSQLLKT